MCIRDSNHPSPSPNQTQHPGSTDIPISHKRKATEQVEDQESTDDYETEECDSDDAATLPANSTAAAGPATASISPASKPICKYGTGCYRKNPQHFVDFAHPWRAM
eukprot:TRINITY_DN37303_c0_g1_i1.p2 TRINITY_DN37303_c0_g1~~TRINITY_DN37303_c0_g1_i1.p2  ORF type:complete len:106 (+),score=18.94 TRINITY_DN37303_c0_g1_i1:148-465(+)